MKWEDDRVRVEGKATKNESKQFFFLAFALGNVCSSSSECCVYVCVWEWVMYDGMPKYVGMSVRVCVCV